MKQIIQQVAKYTKCGKEESENQRDHFQKAAVPSPVLHHSIETPSLVAQVMYQKFAQGLPFVCQEKDWYRMGSIGAAKRKHVQLKHSLQRGMAGPIYNRIHEVLLNRHMLHTDETRIQCNKEMRKKASSELCM